MLVFCVTTLGGKASVNDYANHVLPTHAGLAKRPPNVVGPIGLPNVTSFVSPTRGVNKVING